MRLRRIMSRGVSRKLKVAVIGQPNVGKSTLFNQLTNMSVRGTSAGSNSLEHPTPGLTRDCKAQTVYDILDIPVEFCDTPGIDYLLDDLVIGQERLADISKLFSLETWDMETEGVYESFARFYGETEGSDRRRKGQPWQTQLLRLWRVAEKENTQRGFDGGLESEYVLDKWLLPEKNMIELLYPTIERVRNKQRAVENEGVSEDDNGEDLDESAAFFRNLSEEGMVNIIARTTKIIEEADVVLVMVDGKKEPNYWDKIIASWVKFVLARKEAVREFDELSREK